MEGAPVPIPIVVGRLSGDDIELLHEAKRVLEQLPDRIPIPTAYPASPFTAYCEVRNALIVLNEILTMRDGIDPT